MKMRVIMHASGASGVSDMVVRLPCRVVGWIISDSP